jgi:hypothetical protein
MAVCVDAPKGTVVASDSFFNYENVEDNAPLGITESLEECIHTYDKIRQAGKIFLPLYDPDVLTRHPTGRLA